MPCRPRWKPATFTFRIRLSHRGSKISWRKRPRFPNGRDDDQVDAMTQALNRMRTHHGHFSVPESQIVLEPFCSAGLTDPYALAGDSQYGVLAPSEAFPRAKAAAIKAVALDSTLGEAHISLAWCLDGFGWDWKSGEREFTRGIELSPGYATGHHWYGIWPRWGDMEKP